MTEVLTPEKVRQMFCFQCEQTAGGKACTGKAGVCGKSAEVAGLEDQLTGALIALGQAVVAGATPTEATDWAVIEGMFTCITNVDFDPAAVQAQIDAVHAAKQAIAPADATPDYDMSLLWEAQNEDVRSLKSLILFGMRGTAAYAYHAAVTGRTSRKVNDFFYNTGHDLEDLAQLLDQTDGTGVNVYTHGEMLPAHAYPELKKHPQLKGNFGTAWQNQQREFDGIPAPVLWTTNCLMPPKASYADRVWTTGVVRFPGCHDVQPGADGKKDFSAMIEQAKQLGGYAQAQERTGINGGTKVTVGFGHGTVIGVADKVVEAVKSGAIRKFYLVGGCDGAKPGRNYYTDFVKATPADTVVLTLACGKFRFNDLDLGTIGGLPRLMDMGQCNDAYSAIQVVLALCAAFDCGPNDLPLSIILSWYEQKAVCILLTLLHLGLKNIKLGPSLPAFVSPNVLDVLVKNWGIAPTSTVEADL